MFSSNGLGFRYWSSLSNGSFLGLGQGTDLGTTLVKGPSPCLCLSLGPGLGLGLSPGKSPVLNPGQGSSLDPVLGSV